MKTITFLCALLTCTITAYSAVITYPSNHTTNKLFASDYYKVEVIQNGQTYQTMEYMSKSNAENNSRSQSILNNTISWCNFSFSGTVKVRVTILGGQNKVNYNSTCKVFPARKNISVTKVNSTTAEFNISSAGQYSVEFGNNGYKNGLMIFADPLETIAAPGGGNTKVFTSATPSSLNNLGGFNAVYFADGLHDIDLWYLPTNIKKVYIEGGAVVQGAIYMNNTNNDNTMIYGRGILDGRKLFDKHSTRNSNGIFVGDKYHAIEASTSTSGMTVDGIITSQAGAFFVRLLGQNNTMNNVKTIGGWINNNDGLVGYKNTTITNSFVWACDDGIKLYRDNQTVDNVVMWHMTNGGCFQWCWNTVSADNIRVSNVDIVRGQWTSDGDNQGVFNVRGNTKNQGVQTQDDWIFENINVDNPVKILFNLTPAVEHNITNVQFRNIIAKTDGSVKNRVKGATSNDIRNITFHNLSINGTCITESNKFGAGDFQFANTSNISFTSNGDCGSTGGGGAPSDITDLSASATTCNSVLLAWSDTDGEDQYRVRRRPPGGSYIIVADVPAGTTQFTDASVTENSTYEYMVRPMQNGTAVAVSNVPSVTTPSCQSVPSDITDLTATATDCNSVLLTWSDTDGEDQYRVRRRPPGGSYIIVADVPAGTIQYTDATVAENSTYEYMVRPMQSGVAVAVSNVPSVTTPSCQVITDYIYIDHNSSGFRLKGNGNNSISTQSGGTGDWTQWQEDPTSNGYFYLIHKATGNKLNSSDGTALNLVSPSTTSNNVQWKWIDAGSGWYRLENRQYIKWLHVKPDGITDLILGSTGWTGNNTKWKYTLVPKAANELITDHNSTVKIYPNPAKDIVIISTNKLTEVSFYNIQGQLVYTTEVDGQMELPVQIIGERGLYFMKANDTVQKVVIK